ncbi:MAG: hypothetical protein J6Y58_05575 [Clostridiales bacterium]|nr:hypothetical protein [Clostridiales bacterium]
MKKHTTSERNTPLILTIAFVVIISVFAMSSCAKHKSKEESEPTLADSSSATAATDDKETTITTTSLTEASSETSATDTDTSDSSATEELPPESNAGSNLGDPSDSTSVPGDETTPPSGATKAPNNPTKAPSKDPTKAPTKAPSKATATPKPKATATPAPKENTPTPVPKENTPTPTTKPKPSGDASSSGADTLLNLINEERAKAGVPALTLSDSMNKAARIRAGELAQKYCHYRPPTFEEKKENKGTRALLDVGLTYTAAAENIAQGQGSVSEVFSNWFASDSHKNNMLNSKYSKMGLGYIKANGTTYWCLLLMN